MQDAGAEQITGNPEATDLLGYFKMMGAAAHVLDGAERLEVLHGVFHPDGELFCFD